MTCVKMIRPVILLTIFTAVLCKNNVRSLTESLGQEVIEVGPQLKELPPGLEEEPSAENEPDDKTSSTIQLATKREKKTTTITTQKKVDKIKTASQEEEESKIEKELAEMYKDNIDYKADSSEITNETTTVEMIEEKPALRQRNFKFQPDLNNRADIERFRTSIDEISCERSVTKLSGEQYSNAAMTINVSFFVFSFYLLAVC